MSVKDGLAAIANDVVGDIQKEAEQIILSAEKEAKETLRTAKEQADKNYQTLMSQATARAEGEKRKISSVTEVEMRNRLLQAKEGLVDVAFDKAIANLKDFVATDKYHAYLTKLIEDVSGKIDQGDLVVVVNASDKEYLTRAVLNRLSKKLNRNLTVSEQPENIIGGCKIETSDGKITYDNTIDNKLKELKPVLRVEVAKILFGKED